MNRQFFVLMHRYVGLVMTVFLVVAGFTGIFLAFYTELDQWVNRDMTHITPLNGSAKKIDPFTLREMMAERYPQAEFKRVDLNPFEPNHAARFYLDPKLDPITKKPYDFENDEIYINPYTGAKTGERKWGDISQGVKNLMPFLYRLHYSLALGTVGTYAFGIIALLWAIDCFVGAYLTFPAKQKQRIRRCTFVQKLQQVADWFARWKKSWKVRWGGGFYKVNFDFHRAGGLWLWAMLFVIAWSSVAFNLQEVYRPVTQALFDTQKESADFPKLNQPLLEPDLDYREAYNIAKALALEQAKSGHFDILEESSIRYDASHGIYEYRFRTNLDVSEEYGQTNLLIDANTGKLLMTYFPTGAASGNTITTWIVNIHMAAFWGLPMQIFISIMGLVVTGLSITGVYIWLKKRRSRQHVMQQNHRQSLKIKPL